MDLGKKIRQARQAAGLSQRQLCGEEITRNMLSLIENGAAQPSMKTLKYLALRLDKPLRWFLEENAEEAEGKQHSWELLRLAEQALASGREIYAGQLLEDVQTENAPILRQKLLLQSRLSGADIPGICGALPSLDAELLLRAKGALETGQWDRCAALLNAAEEQSSPRWHLLAGSLQLSRQDYRRAAEHFHLAEAEFPETAPLLEICYRELGDFRRAYEYACMQKG